MQHSNSPIAIVGLGYVGLPLAVEFGRKRNVIGFDINESRIKELKKGIDKTFETTDEELKEIEKEEMAENVLPFPRIDKSKLH